MPKIIGASTYSELYSGGDYADEEWAFIRAVAAYQKRWNRRYPSWREVLHVLKCLGYRKVAQAVPVDERLTAAERELLQAVTAPKPAEPDTKSA